MALRRSNEDAKNINRKRTVDSKRIEKWCLNCNKSFVIPKCRDSREHCCTSECKVEYREKKKAERDRECGCCGEVFRPRQSQLDSGQGIYCSNECARKSSRGRKQSDEWIRKRVDGFKRSEYYKNPNKGRDHAQFKESYIENGYRYITNDNGVKVLEHRHLMELHIGRELKNSEIIHHKNENKLDNRIDNLQIVTVSEHAKIHARLRLHENAQAAY